MSIDIKISSGDNNEVYGKCKEIRYKVFIDEQGFEPEVELDEHEKTSEHILALVDGKPAGTIRLAFKSETLGKLTRLAVLKEYRSIGLARVLIDNLNRRAKASNLTQVNCHSQLPVIGLYKRFGYIEEGEIFDEDGAPHRLLRLNF